MSQLDTGGVVVVTGANEGIGYHLSRALIGDGYRVAALDVNRDGLDALAEVAPDRVHVVEYDVTADEDVEAAVDAVLDRWDRIDVLVNNAAVFDFGLFADRTLEDTRREFEVNFFGYLRTIHAVLPHMRARGSGIIHNVSSGVAAVGHPGLSGYTATKGAVEGLTRTLREELRHEDVWCTLLYPPATRTRSAAALDYPDAATQEPAAVGRKLARKIDSTEPVIYADWQTRLGMALVERVPWLARRGTERFLDRDETRDE
ncbi:SDR family NAD(P)-dependent oxidoreductase [Halosimplex aquaticum]|uniref:SDR family NAD(P)-dependent oxidoreductase n=1 Tax=Halosimplex aquaticum TaxID=3026162 RepID=A0ABD5Y5R8_9EURY|nr:SDR family NAD(P)-dependent oxidoreductase [Halosimplex aquaticum]